MKTFRANTNPVASAWKAERLLALGFSSDASDQRERAQEHNKTLNAGGVKGNRFSPIPTVFPTTHLTRCIAGSPRRYEGRVHAA